MLLNCGVREDSLRIPWTARRSNQSILKEISLGCSFEGLMLKLKCQYFGHLIQRADSFPAFPWCWERLKVGGEGDDREWDGWMASPTQWTWVWVDSRSWWWTRRPGVLWFMGSQRVGHDWVATELNWTECLPQDRPDAGFMGWNWALNGCQTLSHILSHLAKEAGQTLSFLLYKEENQGSNSTKDFLRIKVRLKCYIIRW